MISKFCTSSVGRKYLMGFSGIIWTGFIMAHMAGNLLIFVSPEAYNSYGHALVNGGVIYFVEALLVATILMHVYFGIRLTLKNWGSRPQRYAASGGREKGAAFGSKTMIFHGSIILVFLILHLATFKFGKYYSTTVNGVEMRDLYRLMVEVFANPTYVAWYLVALVFVGIHVQHGLKSAFQSFGLLHPAYQKAIRYFGYVYGTVVAAGFISQPVYMFFFLK